MGTSEAKIVAFTGHRSEDCEPESWVRTKARIALRDATGIETVITGLANGFDLWAADEAITLGIEVWGAKPWAGHGPRNGDEELYAKIIENASRVVNVNESEEFPGAFCYHDRNHWMVRNSTHVMSYWNPSKTSGGTYECRKYAKNVGKPVKNIFFYPPF